MNSPVDGCAHANCFKERFFFLYGAVLSGSLFEQKPTLFFFRITTRCCSLISSHLVFRVRFVATEAVLGTVVE